MVEQPTQDRVASPGRALRFGYRHRSLIAIAPGGPQRRQAPELGSLRSTLDMDGAGGFTGSGQVTDDESSTRPFTRCRSAGPHPPVESALRICQQSAVGVALVPFRFSPYELALRLTANS